MGGLVFQGGGTFFQSGGTFFKSGGTFSKMGPVFVKVDGGFLFAIEPANVPVAAITDFVTYPDKAWACRTPNVGPLAALQMVSVVFALRQIN